MGCTGFSLAAASEDYSLLWCMGFSLWWLLLLQSTGFPDSSVGKESACNAGDPSSIPGSGDSLEK